MASVRGLLNIQSQLNESTLTRRTRTTFLLLFDRPSHRPGSCDRDPQTRGDRRGRRSAWGKGTFPIVFGYISYQIRILLYPDAYPDPDVSWKDTRILTYPDVSQMYLTCSVTFEENTAENTCILMYILS